MYLTSRVAAWLALLAACVSPRCRCPVDGSLENDGHAAVWPNTTSIMLPKKTGTFFGLDSYKFYHAVNLLYIWNLLLPPSQNK